MKPRLLIATNNPGKLTEYREILGSLPLDLVTPAMLELEIQVKEDGETYTENALLKARVYAKASGLVTLADDSGLEVDALGGAPGVHSHRFDGGLGDDASRYRLLLERLKDVPAAERMARFRCVTVIATPQGATYTCEGVCPGVILSEPRGEGGFGYDPVFLLPELGRTMAELSREEKNRVSHRGRAGRQARAILLRLFEREMKDMATILLIGNKSDDTLSFVDTRTLQILGTAITGRGPHEVVVAPDGRRAYVANYEGPGDSLSVVDVAAMEEQRRIAIDPYRGPHGLAFSSDGRMLYVTCERSQAVIELDVSTEKITRAFHTHQDITHMLVLTPDNKKLYTANIRSGTATAIDLLTGMVVAQISTGAGCEGIDVTPVGGHVWTTNRAADTLSVIDTTDDSVIATLACPGFPIRVKFTPEGDLALVSCATANQVAVWDVDAQEEVRRIDIGNAPIGVLIEPGGFRAFVANTEADTVSVLDLENLAVVGEIHAGREPDGMALAL